MQRAPQRPEHQASSRQTGPYAARPRNAWASRALSPMPHLGRWVKACAAAPRKSGSAAGPQLPVEVPPRGSPRTTPWPALLKASRKSFRASPSRPHAIVWDSTRCAKRSVNAARWTARASPPVSERAPAGQTAMQRMHVTHASASVCAGFAGSIAAAEH